jgi:ABC-type branched-subunit amino acid transport system ATPase component
MTNERPILRLERVTKRFGGMTAIDDLSFDVRRGSRTALIGPNGAGKTTVFNIVTVRSRSMPAASMSMAEILRAWQTWRPSAPAFATRSAP